MLKALFKDPLTSATTLHTACIKLFGLEYVNFDPETVRQDLKEMYDDVSEESFDKIQAMCTIISTDNFYNFIEPFFSITNTLNCKDPHFNIIAPLDAPLITWAILEAKLNDKDDEVYSPEVQEFINVCFRYNGVPHLPKQLNGIIKYSMDIEDDDFDADIDYYITSRKKRLADELSQLEEKLPNN